MHRYLARALACLGISLAFSLLTTLTHHSGEKKVRLRTDGQTADIVAAVEALKRSDVSIEVAPDPFITNPAGSFIIGSLGLTVLLWLASGTVKRAEEWFSVFAARKKDANSDREKTTL